MLPLILNCVLFSLIATLLFICSYQPEDTQLFYQEKIRPHLKSIRRTLLNSFRPRPIIYDLTHLIHSSPCFTIYLYRYNNSTENEDFFNECRNKPILPAEIKQAFENDGVVAIRGLILPQSLLELDHASNILISREKDRLRLKGHEFSSGKQFQTKKMGPLFDLSEQVSAFRNVALMSLLPKIVAELLDLDYDTSDGTSSNHTTQPTLRVLRDVFLAKDEGQFVCGWHVDDWGFWPSSAASDGVNVWIGS